MAPPLTGQSVRFVEVGMPPPRYEVKEIEISEMVFSSFFSPIPARCAARGGGGLSGGEGGNGF